MGRWVSNVWGIYAFIRASCMIWPANALPSSCADHPEEVPIMLKRLVSTALVALVVLALLPAGGDAQAPGPIKIGVIQPLSGPVAASGNYVRMGAEIARDWINARGGVNGRRGELVMEALGLEQYVEKLGVKKADFLAVKTDWGRGSITAFGDMLRKKGVQVGAAEFMEQAATDMNAQLTKIKQTGGDTLFLTTAVEQITLVLKQGQEQRLARKIITTGGSSSPTQLIKQAGAAAEGSYHIVFFMPWFPEAMPDGRLARAFVDEWTKRGNPFEGLTEGFRGHDGVATIVEAVRLAGRDEPKAIQEALWKVSFTGVNGPIKFEKDGPAGKESGQSKPSIFIVQVRDGKVALPDFLKK